MTRIRYANLSRQSARSRFVAAALLTVGCLFFSTRAVAQPQTEKRFVVIVANNRSLDEGVQPLEFADDDGARYYETFTASGAETRLLMLPDEKTQAKFPQAAAAASLPSREKLTAALQETFDRIRQENQAGYVTHFTFVYAGHGNVGPNREGYLNLLDAKLSRRDLFANIIAPSPASFNHLILDACNAYFVVNKRGDVSHREQNFADDLREFLRSESLGRYPNTGVILAASEDSETHEWTKLESGIFSHEILSALSGTADVDEDGIVTYQEAAACIEAANFGIRNQKARLNVYFRPPENRQNVPLMSLLAFEDTPSLVLEKEIGGRYYIEDARGVRTADLHFSTEQSVKIHLVGEPPFYLRNDNTEAEIDAADSANGAVSSSKLTFNPLGEKQRGSVEQSFRKHLFEVPFGMGFYLGMFAATKLATGPEAEVSAASPVSTDARPSSSVKNDSSKSTDPSKVYLAAGWTTSGLGAASGIVSGVMWGAGRSTWNSYETETKTETAKALRDEAETRLRISRAFMGAGIALCTVGVVTVIFETVRRHKRETSGKPKTAPTAAFANGFGQLGAAVEF